MRDWASEFETPRVRIQRGNIWCSSRIIGEPLGVVTRAGVPAAETEWSGLSDLRSDDQHWVVTRFDEDEADPSVLLLDPEEPDGVYRLSFEFVPVDDVPEVFREVPHFDVVAGVVMDGVA